MLRLGDSLPERWAAFLIDRNCFEAHQGERARQNDDLMHRVEPERRNYTVVIGNAVED